MGHATPWSEGYVVRFWHQNGSNWVANFQGETGADGIFDLPGAESLLVIAHGSIYVLPKADPESCVYRGAGVREVWLEPQHQLLILAYAGGDLEAIGSDGKVVWARPDFAVDGLHIQSCIDGILTVDVEYDYYGSWRPVHISVIDGTDQPRP